MDTLLYLLARGLIALVQALPLRGVARLGRAGGALAWWLDGRHRRVAMKNLTRSFPGKPRQEVAALAKENFRRIGESFACGIKTAGMSVEELRPHVEFVVPAAFTPAPGEEPRSLVVAIGHFGNFELYARFGQFCPGYQCATTYRGLRQAALNRLLQTLREKSGCLFFERRFDADKLKAVMNRPGIMLGLLCDQNGGRKGLQLPFLGHNASTSPAVALFALRYHCPLHVAVCYRTGLGQWRIEAGAEIPTHEDGQSRSTTAILRDVNAAFEAAVRRDPANWFWVHNRWKHGLPTTEG
jgi:KDO2-lipid IV(A) lauroyltransferase